MNLGDELAIITSVANEDLDSFKRGLIGWCEWSNMQPNLDAIALDPTWDTNRIVAELDDKRIQLLAKILKEIQTMPLKGYQLSFIPDVEPYWIENPQIIGTSSGVATVTRTEIIGPSQIIWADYGSGIEHPHQPEDVTVVYPPEQTPQVEVVAAPDDAKSRKRRRYPGKGKASGWIETRKTNRKREKPSEYLVYRWQDGDGKHSRYLKGAIAPVVRQMIAGGSSVSEVLRVMKQTPQQEDGCDGGRLE